MLTAYSIQMPASPAGPRCSCNYRMIRDSCDASAMTCNVEVASDWNLVSLH